MSDTDLMNLTVPELKKKLAEYGLSRSGRKNDMVARLEQAGMLGDKEKADEENSNEKDEMTTKRVNDAAGEPGTSGEPVKKKLKIGKMAGAAGKSERESAPTPCLKSCRPGKQHGCANRSYGKPQHGKTKSCHEVDRILTVLGVNYDASRCIKAAIMRGYINIKGEEGDLDLVVYQQEGECGHVIQAKLGDLLRQPDYAGLDYEDGCMNATVICTQCDEGRTYVTGLCKGEGTFDDGKYHNHCWGCPGFGSCIGDYRLRHCDSCGDHPWVGLMGRAKGESKCDNKRCIIFKKWQANKMKKTMGQMLGGDFFPDEAIKKIAGVSPHPSEDSDSDSD